MPSKIHSSDRKNSKLNSKRLSSVRTFDARADTLDFRDQMFVPTLIEVPLSVSLETYKSFDIPILDQGREGACTGYALATVINYLLKHRSKEPGQAPVSPRMLYELARRYDEWPGEDYEGSSARGAMKGWHKHGISTDALWRGTISAPAKTYSAWSEELIKDARKRPLGAYFRVNHKDLVAMHAAIAEVGILYVTAVVHEGWGQVDEKGDIPMRNEPTGGHAFAVVAYDDIGFWIQNSWGEDWGYRGFARLSYDDWLQNGTDVWVARIGVPVVLNTVLASAQSHPSRSGESRGYAFEDIRPHLISVGNDGKLQPGGSYGTSRSELDALFEGLKQSLKAWSAPKIMLYAHGGLVAEEDAVQRVAEFRPALMAREIYPLAFIWHSDFLSTLGNLLKEAVKHRRNEGTLDSLKDFMLDRLDDMLEPVARQLLGKLAWSEMKENALAASNKGCAAYLVADWLARLVEEVPNLEIHLVGHSAGSIFLAPVLKLLKERNLAARTCTLWAPACTHEDYENYYAPALKNGALKALALYMLSDVVEQADNCASIYNKSLLYLVSHAFEDKVRIPGLPMYPGVPLLGMHKFIDPENKDYKKDFAELLKKAKVDVVVSPNDEPVNSLKAAKATHHGDFDNDERTALSTLARILGGVIEDMRPRVINPMSGVPEIQVPLVDSAKTETIKAVPLVFRKSAGDSKQMRRELDVMTVKN